MDISTCLRPPMFISLVPPGVVSTLCAPMFRRKYTTDPWTDLLDEVRVHESNLSSIKQLVMSLGPKSDASIASAELRCWDLAWAAWRESYNTLLAEEKAMRPPKPPGVWYGAGVLQGKDRQLLRGFRYALHFPHVLAFESRLFATVAFSHVYQQQRFPTSPLYSLPQRLYTALIVLFAVYAI
ncbi:hypothetical protein BC835DRAFT_1419574 [Cytidiella melzeri]|nr:hypothetical protein BC835DRAFT_1419574 [Cytidiella melzeri]